MTDDFVQDPRRAMTPARKRRIHAARGGRCWFCKMPVPESGPEVEYDHIIQLWIKGSDADHDIAPLHVRCHAIKTKADAASRGKVKRLIKTRTTDPEDRPPSKLQGRGFDKTITRGFNGKVRARKQRRTP